MNARTQARRSLAFACAFLVLIMLPLAGCDTESLLSGPDSDTDLALRLVDQESMIMGKVDIASAIEFVESIVPAEQQGMISTDEGLIEFTDLTGIDPRTDISSAFIAVSHTGENAAGALLLFVDFDQEAVTDLLDGEDELTRLSDTGFTDAFTGSEGHLFMALHEGRLILLASSENELSNMSARLSDGSYSRSSDLLDEVKRNQHWLVVQNVNRHFPEELDADGPFSQYAQIGATIQDFAIAANILPDKIGGTLVLHPDESVDPEDLENVLKGLRAAARLQLEGESDLIDLLNEMEISSDSRFVHMSMDLELDQLREIVDRYAAEARDTISKRFHEKSRE